jgi:hypothetical protein
MLFLLLRIQWPFCCDCVNMSINSKIAVKNACKIEVINKWNINNEV